MKKTQEDIFINEVEFQVVYWYSHGEPATYWEPGCPDEIDIEAVFLEGKDVTEFLAEWVFDKMIEQIEAPTVEDEEADYADYHYSERRDSMLFKD